MDNQTVCNKLNELIQLDVDTVHNYDAAIKKAEDNDICRKLKEFQQDHKRHIIDLSEKVRSLGGNPIEHKQDIKGQLQEVMTSLRSLTGDNGVLETMASNEEATNKKYEEALSLREIEQDAELSSIIRRNWEDEKRHLEYIQQAVEVV